MTRFHSYRFGPFLLDARAWRLERNGEKLAVQPQVFRTLLYLLRHDGRVIPKEELFAELWPGRIVTDGVLTRCIKELRRVLDDDARNARFIRTTPRIGYAFVADVQALIDPGQVPPSLAVLPFRPDDPAAPDEALEFGFTDRLIQQLSSLRGLLVRPWSAVRNTPVGQDPLDAAREQGVDFVLEGTLAQSADGFAVSVRLLKVADGSLLLSRNFQEPFTELAATQDSIGRCIAETLEQELSARASQQLAGRPASSLRAYRHFLLGRLHAGRHTPAADRRSIELYRQAVALDPGYALAWAALAETCTSLGTLETDAGHFEAAREHATRALALQPDLVPAMTCLGNIAWMHDWDWEAARHYLGNGIEAAPGNADAQIAYSDFCAHMRFHEEAISAASQALEIDPNSAWVNALLAQALHMAGLHHEAHRQAQRALEISSDFAFAQFFAGLSSIMCQRWERGIGHIEAAHKLSARGDFLSALGWAYAVAGRHDDALGVLAQLEGAGNRVPPILRAFVHLGLGEADRTCELLEQAADARDWHVLLVYAEPAFRPIRTHPRVVHLLERLRLPV